MGHFPPARLALLLLAFAAACGDSSGSAKPPASSLSSPSGLLFVLGAPSARLERDVDGAGRLVLQDPGAGVTSFTDRPQRSANTLTLTDFLAGWTRYGFAATPPNAALVVQAAPGSADVAVFEISSPRFSDGALSFDVVPLAGTTSSGLRELADRADPSLPQDLGSVSLFVDASGDATVYQQIELQVSNAQPGQTVAVEVAAGNAAIGWSFGPPVDDAAGLLLSGEGGTLPVEQLQIDATRFVVTTSTDFGGGGGSLSFNASLYLVTPEPVSVFSLTSSSDPGVLVSASIAGAAPEPLNPTPTQFAWAP